MILSSATSSGARDRTLGLTDVDEPTLVAQHDPLMSPLVWDLAHVGQQEELWLLRGGDQARPGMLPPDVGRALRRL
jgi:iron(II)-dependent oxidoreductase